MYKLERKNCRMISSLTLRALSNITWWVTSNTNVYHKHVGTNIYMYYTMLRAKSASPIHKWGRMDIYRVVRKVKQSFDGRLESIEAVTEGRTWRRYIITDNSIDLAIRTRVQPRYVSNISMIYPRSHFEDHAIDWCSIHISPQGTMSIYVHDWHTCTTSWRVVNSKSKRNRIFIRAHRPFDRADLVKPLSLLHQILKGQCWQRCFKIKGPSSSRTLQCNVQSY
jgi:hypothetical protein